MRVDLWQCPLRQGRATLAGGSKGPLWLLQEKGSSRCERHLVVPNPLLAAGPWSGLPCALLNMLHLPVQADLTTVLRPAVG